MTATTETDVLILGGGPAGLAAAKVVAAAGLNAILVDENARLGGQINRLPFRGPPVEFERVPPRLEVRLRTVGLGFLEERTVALETNGVGSLVTAKAIVIATGATERVYAVPGWTKVGVMTAGAAQTFIKGSGSFPYKRVVVAGTGPLLLASASQLIKARVDVAAVIESASIAGTRPRQALSLVNGGRILIDGARYISTLARSGTKIMTASAVTEIFGDQRVRGVRIRRVKRDWSLDPTTQPLDLECDAVLLSQGFNSSVAFASQGGAELSWNAQAAAWEPSRDELYRTTLPRVWSVGDCAGVGGSVVAEMEGKVAGEAIVEELTGRTVATPRSQRRTARRLQRLNNFRFAMEELFPSGSVATAAADEGTCVCRCQEVSAGDVRMAVRSGARSVRSVKLWTRAGMGTCQGRTCNFLIERIVGAELNMPLEQVTNKPSFQFPLRPVDSRVLNQLEQRVGDE